MSRGKWKSQYLKNLSYADTEALERARQLARENLERLKSQSALLPQSDYIARPLTVPIRLSKV
jgi:hypothetical protein